MIKDELSATVLEIQRMSTEDGPGIRTTVFFKGCPLNCLWCHNPESILSIPQVQWIGMKCIGCKSCVGICVNHAISSKENSIIIDRNLCKGCGQCASECPSTAMEILGKKWNVESLVKEVIKDKAYFDKSGGGITISGGEPTLQAKFASLFLKSLKENNIHTALDTCGLCSKEAFDMLLPYTDIVLYDIKEIIPEKHKIFTGSNNDKILENLVYVSNYLKDNSKKLWIRTPIIPNTTATKENIEGIAKFILKYLDGIVNRWELCAFNNLCKDKYLRFEIDWQFKNCSLMTRKEMDELVETAKNAGVNSNIVKWSGSNSDM